MVPRSWPRTVQRRRDKAIKTTPRPTIAPSVISTLRDSLSPILMAPPAWRSCEFDPRTNPSFRPRWPSLGHPYPAPRPSLELVRARPSAITLAWRRLSSPCIPWPPAGGFRRSRRGRVPVHSTNVARDPGHGPDRVATSSEFAPCKPGGEISLAMIFAVRPDLLSAMTPPGGQAASDSCFSSDIFESHT